MSDTLEVFGQEYTGVEGFKATDSNGDTQRYVNANQYLPLTGGTVTGTLNVQDDLVAYNGIKTKDTNDNTVSLIQMSNSNNVVVNGADIGKTYLGGIVHFNNPLDNHLVLPISTGLKSVDSNGDNKTLIYLAANNNVRINSDTSGVTQIVSNTEVTGTITSTGTVKSTGGALVANNCTTWNGGTAGGFLSTNGRCGLVSGSSDDYPNVVFSKNKNTSAATVLRANNTGTTTYTLTLPNSTGTLAISSSDIRLKENIKDVEVSGLDLINKIKLHQFDWLEEGHEGSPHWKVGVIADELQELDPKLTTGGGYEEDGSMNIKSVEILYLTSYLIKAVQELSQEVKRLKNGGE